MSQAIIDKVLSSPRLPSLPAIALEVIDLVQNPDVSLKDIASTIQNDPALAGKILKTVNSSFYGQPRRITTITNALVVLGLNSVKTLALGFSLVSNMKNVEPGQFDHNAYWRRSVNCAAAAKLICELSGEGEPEEAFLGALLQDLGMLAMHMALEKSYVSVYRLAGGLHRELWKVEKEELGVTHPEVGACLAEKWRLPSVLTDCIRFHENASSCKNESMQLVRCVALAGQIADLLDETQKISPKRSQVLARNAKEWFNIHHTAFDEMVGQIDQRAREIQALLDVSCDFGNPERVMEKAQEALQQITLQTAMEAEKLEKQNQELTEAAHTDPLTGVSNRMAFEQFLKDEFEAAREGAGPISVLFSDTDHFKQFNDTYGHQIGDQVLIHQAKFLRQMCPKNGMAARYGGEEFALILPETDRRQATVLAEKIRAGIQSLDTVKDAHGNILSITNSIGVATYDGTLFKSGQQLVMAADKAVYAAKKSGRNCVRVFAPRVKPAAA